jgi:hypothetical protein
MVDWSFASVVLAIIGACITLSISPVVLSALRELLESVRNTLSPTRTHCRRLTDDDVSQVSELHRCVRWTGNRLPKYGHSDVVTLNPRLCELSLPSQFFFPNAAGPYTYVRKPTTLEIDQTYLRMNAWTLGAYLLHWHGLHWADRHLQPRLDIREVGDILVGVVVAEPQRLPLRPWPTICHLTRNDVEGILRGYPPFYRRRLITMNGEIVEHPIRNIDDVQRGGWIVAIGLCKPFIAGKHRMRNPDLGQEERLAHLLHVIRPFRRIYEVFEHFSKAFPDESFVSRVYLMAKNIRTHDRSTTSRSAAWFYNSDILAEFGGFRIDSREYLRGLTADQCQTAMDAFNHFDPLSTKEVEILRPVLKKVLIAVIHGMYIAADWDEKDARLDYLDSSWLDAPRRAVYVREICGEGSA